MKASVRPNVPAIFAILMALLVVVVVAVAAVLWWRGGRSLDLPILLALLAIALVNVAGLYSRWEGERVRKLRGRLADPEDHPRTRSLAEVLDQAKQLPDPRRAP